MSDMKFVTLASFVTIGLLMIAAAVPIASPVRHVFAEFNVKVSDDCIQARDNSQQVLIGNSSNAIIINNSTTTQSQNCG